MFYFTPLRGFLLIFPSLYYFAIGLSGVFSLTRWSSLIHTGFHVPHATRDKRVALFALSLMRCTALHFVQVQVQVHAHPKGGVRESAALHCTSCKCKCMRIQKFLSDIIEYLEIFDEDLFKKLLDFHHLWCRIQLLRLLIDFSLWC
jgi:hypothetical protein